MNSHRFAELHTQFQALGATLKQTREPEQRIVVLKAMRELISEMETLAYLSPINAIGSARTICPLHGCEMRLRRLRSQVVANGVYICPEPGCQQRFSEALSYFSAVARSERR
jgi:hypothetical protein